MVTSYAVVKNQVASFKRENFPFKMARDLEEEVSDAVHDRILSNRQIELNVQRYSGFHMNAFILLFMSI